MGRRRGVMQCVRDYTHSYGYALRIAACIAVNHSTVAAKGREPFKREKAMTLGPAAAAAAAAVVVLLLSSDSETSPTKPLIPVRQ
jgi:hypothetical protein